MPDKPSKYAKEGTAAHKVLEFALNAGELFRRDCDTEEQYQALRIAVDAVAEEKARYSSVRVFSPETRVFPSRREDLFGTADVIIAGFLPNGEGGVTVLDYKHGENVAVLADTPQLAIYLLGAANHVGFRVDHFRAVIVQPRLRFGSMPKVRACDRTLREMIAFSRSMHEAAALTDAPDAVPVAGKHCKWCRAKPSCTAYRALSPQRNSRTDAEAFDLCI